MEHDFALSYSANTADGLSQGNSLCFSFSHEKSEDSSQYSVNADCNHWRFYAGINFTCLCFVEDKLTSLLYRCIYKLVSLISLN